MATRTVQLDDDGGQILDELIEGTGLTAPEVVRRGLHILRDSLSEPVRPSAWEIYEKLDLGPGGYAVAPSTESRRGVQEAIRRKHSR
jgi:hypothetical protein